jgi:nicotinamide N-methyltransferase
MDASPSSGSDQEETEALDLFTEPPDYYPPSPKPTTQIHTLLSGQTLTLNLVGHNPLWGHHLWNAGRLISTYLEQNPSLIKNKTVLELGAGAGLPSLVCGILGAKKVVCTDYPDRELVENLRGNIEEFERDFGGNEGESESKGIDGRVVAEGYCWGADPAPLLSHLPSSPSPTDKKPNGFDILILADLLFNHSEHRKLLSTIQQTLSHPPERSEASHSSSSQTPEAKALVFFTPYRPWLYEKDMAFFDLAREAGFVVEKVLEEKMERVMFEDDPGDEELRRTVFGFVLRWGVGQ